MATPSLGPDVPLDVPRLVETRMLVQANSGGGKSWAIRRLCEVAYGGAQQIILDPEGEFHTLREKFDYVLAGRSGGDCPADLKSAALLARRLLELNVSAVVDIFELGAQRARFVRLFLEALMQAPRELWHPTIVVIDEANKFCPEHGKAESHDAVIDLMTRGRKRGFAGVLATQRISDLAKSAAAECNNKLIGRSSLDVDMKRAAAEIGFTSKEEQLSLRRLDDGQFYAFGPALTRAVTKFRVGPVTTTHPRAGQRAVPVTAPRERVRKILAQLADLPQEAEAEAQTVGELRARVRELERAAKAAPAPVVQRDLKPEKVIIERPVIKPVDIKRLEAFIAKLDRHQDRAQAFGDQAFELRTVVRQLLDKANVEPPALRPDPVLTPRRYEAAKHGPAVIKTFPVEFNVALKAALKDRAAANVDNLDGPMRRVLGALAWFEAIGVAMPAATPVAFLSGYKGENGTFNNVRGKLRAGQLIDYPMPGLMALTEIGRAAAPVPDVPRDGAGLREAVMLRLDGPQRRVLQPLIDAYPGDVPAGDLAVAAGYGGENGTFNNVRGRLRSLSLITYPRAGAARAADLLFPDGV